VVRPRPGWYVRCGLDARPEAIRSAESALELPHEQARQAGVLSEDVGIESFGRIVERFVRNFRALLDHRPEPYSGRVEIYRAADGASAETTKAWLTLCTGDATSIDVHYRVVQRL
jgi:hypothetical protein